ncbi:hypothetical protein [Sinorhizobium meliloti]|uniref:hypothetical protein n=1 Tax=Rhizobium meliloti TaxID=382 RepID=UPI000482361C|nr:hypothetical protein [Sinorhizobium meliloti]UDU21830.1 hypothetical protein LJD24_24540 [Sinorhizobium meliloti]WQP03224.1 hypothetical protein U8C39_00245 [Sinorhizobium meliloti]WQP16543.1 hypothetical protein U8C33_00245 [Sinorhizobium meliloti]WQP29979.1 hypothetical protein U8C45_00255 [Sinorhizobium meliloti]
MIVVIDCHSGGRRRQRCTEKKRVPCRHFFLNPSRPKSGRIQMPTNEWPARDRVTFWKILSVQRDPHE